MYDIIRRQKYQEIVDPISSENIRRLFDQDPDKALENDTFLQLCLKTEKDEAFSREFQLVKILFSVCFWCDAADDLIY
jgi:hypothetical protein